jgi:hypothetical protein
MELDDEKKSESKLFSSIIPWYRNNF